VELALALLVELVLVEQEVLLELLVAEVALVIRALEFQLQP